MRSKMCKRKRLASAQGENFKTYEKDNNTNKKVYLFRSIQNVNKTAATVFLFLQLQGDVNRIRIISYKLHQRQLKMKKTSIPIYN